MLLLGFLHEPSPEAAIFGLHGSRITAYGVTLGQAGSVTPEALEQVRRGLLTEQLRTAALLRSVPDEQHIWIATEWPTRLVVHSDLEHLLGPVLDSWERTEFREDLRLLILTPRREIEAELPRIRPAVEVPTARLFRESLGGDRPVVTGTSLDPVLAKPEEWFGELALGSVGGAMALLTTSAQDAHGRHIGLRNPAALGWRLAEEAGSLQEALRAGGVTARCHGFMRAALPTRPLPKGPGDYAVVLTLTCADEDPELVIPIGAVFEQAGYGERQSLATSSATTTTVLPGRTVAIAMAAWCLNQPLAPPSGEELRPTPLQLAWAPRSQDALWRDIERRLAGSRAWRDRSL